MTGNGGLSEPRCSAISRLAADIGTRLLRCTGAPRPGLPSPAIPFPSSDSPKTPEFAGLWRRDSSVLAPIPTRGACWTTGKDSEIISRAVCTPSSLGLVGVFRRRCRAAADRVLQGCDVKQILADATPRPSSTRIATDTQPHIARPNLRARVSRSPPAAPPCALCPVALPRGRLQHGI